MKDLFKIRGSISKKTYMTGMIATFLVIIIAWVVATGFELVTPLFLPSPNDIITEFLKVLKSGELLQNTWISTYRILIGFILAVVLMFVLSSL